MLFESRVLWRDRNACFYYFETFISIGRLEATADADWVISDGGRSWAIRKRLISVFPEIYWTGFLGPVRKYRYISKVARYF